MRGLAACGSRNNRASMIWMRIVDERRRQLRSYSVYMYAAVLEGIVAGICFTEVARGRHNEDVPCNAMLIFKNLMK